MWRKGYGCKAMKSRSQVQILDDVVYTSLRTNAIGKGYESISYLRKIVRFVTDLEERKKSEFEIWGMCCSARICGTFVHRSSVKKGVAGSI